MISEWVVGIAGGSEFQSWDEGGNPVTLDRYWRCEWVGERVRVGVRADMRGRRVTALSDSVLCVRHPWSDLEPPPPPHGAWGPRYLPPPLPLVHQEDIAYTNTCPVHSPYRYRYVNGGPDFFPQHSHSHHGGVHHTAPHYQSQPHLPQHHYHYHHHPCPSASHHVSHQVNTATLPPSVECRPCQSNLDLVSRRLTH